MAHIGTTVQLVSSIIIVIRACSEFDLTAIVGWAYGSSVDKAVLVYAGHDTDGRKKRLRRGDIATFMVMPVPKISGQLLPGLGANARG